MLAPFFTRGGNEVYQHSEYKGNNVGFEYQYKSTPESMLSAGLSTDGMSVTTTARKMWPVAEGTTLDAILRHNTATGMSYDCSVQRNLVEPTSERNTHVEAFGNFGLRHVDQMSMGVGVRATNAKHVTVEGGLVFNPLRLESSLPLGDLLPELQVSWKKHHGPSVTLSTSLMGNVSVGYSVWRGIDRYSSIRFGSSLNLNGLRWDFEYHRSKQRISVPVQLTDEIPSISWVIGLFAAPLIVDAIFQALFLAPLRYRRMRQQREELLKGMARARYEQRFQRAEAEEGREVELSSRGIVILQARFGLHTDRAAPSATGDTSASPTWIEVAIVLQHRVHHERDHSRLVLAEDFSKIPGFYDCAPEDDKELVVHYLYRNEYHVASYEEGEPVILPQAEHRLDEEEDWRS